MNPEISKAIEEQFSALLGHAIAIEAILEKDGGGPSLIAKAAKANGLEPAFVHHLISLATTEPLRRKGILEKTTSEQFITTASMVAGIAGQMSPAMRFHFLGALYYFLGMQDGS